MEARREISSTVIDNPPGGLVIWILILLELLTFGVALMIMVYMRGSEEQLFKDMAGRLDLRLGALNTAMLLSSGYAMAMSVHRLSQGASRSSDGFFAVAMVLGLGFLLVKGLEYRSKIKEGLSLGQNTFMDFYWLLTGFHAIHVIVGIMILLAIRAMRSRQDADQALSYVESGAAFWHLCDLIWLLIFPALYL